MQTQPGAFRLFAFRGITVSLHWTWFLIAGWVILERGFTGRLEIDAAIYLSLFAIVLLHEFGHALACRQVGGKAERILLWPLGGVAYVQPPPRPGPVLWSIAAGPLVNVALAPPLIWASYAVNGGLLADPASLWGAYLQAVAGINLVLLIFNLLPVYPLDGGQILMALLWFVVGRGQALRAVSVIGLFAGAGAVGVALYHQNLLFGVLALFIVWQAWVGLRSARILLRFEKQGVSYGDLQAMLAQRHRQAQAQQPLDARFRVLSEEPPSGPSPDPPR
ncbi:MAG: M50 family metallopeptidase [Planctomycetota bacterium]